MLQGKPVIKIEYLSIRMKLLLTAVFTLGVLFSGFVLGMVVALTDHTPDVTTIERELRLPLAQSYQPGTYNDKLFSNENEIPDIAVWDPKDFDAEVQCLAKNIYFEAKSESREGQVAVGLVTINRVLSEKYPDTICDVVWQKGKHPTTGKWVAQFSWTWDGKEDKPVNKKAWAEAQRIAEAMLAERSLFNFADFTEGATHYHADYVSPYWRNSFTPVLTVDTHLFYRDEDATPREYRTLTTETVALNDDHKI